MSKVSEHDENMKDIFDSMDSELEMVLEEVINLQQENADLKAKIKGLEETIAGYENLTDYSKFDRRRL